MFVGFIGSFGFIRLSARLMRSPRVPWWPGSVVSESGVHLHHLGWGIGAMMVSGDAIGGVTREEYEARQAEHDSAVETAPKRQGGDAVPPPPYGVR